MFWKKLNLLLLLLSFPLTLKAAGYECCPVCCHPSPDLCCGWSLYADWIYWKTRRCELDYAVPLTSGSNSIGNVFDVKTTYDSGFRVGFRKMCNCLFFDAFYTSYSNRVSDATSSGTGALAGTHVVDAVGGVGQGDIAFARGRWRIDYHTLDLLAGLNITNRCCFQTHVFGGPKFAWIDQRLESFYSANASITGDAVRVKQKIDMDAYGVDFGFGSEFNIWDCFKVFGRLSFDLLLADFDRNFTYDTSTNGGATFTRAIDLQDDCWRIVSVLNLAVGIGYDFELCCRCISKVGIALGYEIHQWVNSPDFLEFQNESGEITFDRHLQSLGFDGLFVRLAVSF